MKFRSSFVSNSSSSSFIAIMKKDKIKNWDDFVEGLSLLMNVPDVFQTPEEAIGSILGKDHIRYATHLEELKMLSRDLDVFYAVYFCGDQSNDEVRFRKQAIKDDQFVSNIVVANGW